VLTFKLQEKIDMKNFIKGVALATAVLCSSSVLAEEKLEFDGGIGSHPSFSNTNTVPTTHINTNVQGVPAGGQLWVVKSLRAVITDDGNISLRGKGLLLGGGNNIGTRGGPRQVVATLFTRATPTPPATTGATTAFNSEFVDLDANGDFTIKGPLKDASGAAPLGYLGDNIDNRPILLIRTVTNGAPGNWFAAGILKDR
jgi:hypothetical protein